MCLIFTNKTIGIFLTRLVDCCQLAMTQNIVLMFTVTRMGGVDFGHQMKQNSSWMGRALSSPPCAR